MNMELNDALSELVDMGYVTDWANEYGEPGYSTDGLVVLGDYWCHDRECNFPDRYDDGTRKCHDAATHYPEHFQTLEDAGVELEWYDEWMVDHETGKAWRTSPDSYSWEPSVILGDGDWITPDDDIDAWLEIMVNDPHRALPSHVWTDDELGARGFRELKCGYEAGLHPGQDADPSAILDAIRGEMGYVDVLFKLSGVGQFDVRFCVFVRDGDWEDAED